MKGGKGGQGRKRSQTKVVSKEKPRPVVKKGEAKRDWGAMTSDPDDKPKPLPGRERGGR